jgi:multidrug efflux pump
VLSFAPILLLQGNVGEFVGTIGTTVVISLTVSLALSLTVVTALAGLLPLRAVANAASPTIGDAVAPTGWRRLPAHLRRPRLLLLATLLPPLLGFALTPTLRDQFFPAADRDQFQVEIWAEGGASLQQTTDLMQRADAALRRDEQVTQTFWVAGQSVPSVYYNQLLEQDDAPFYAQGVVVARDVASAKELVRRAERELPALLPEAHVVVRPFIQGPPIAAPVVLRLVGDELARLIAGGDAVRAVMAATPGVLHTRASIPAALPVAELRFDEAALRQLGLSTEQAAQQLRAQLGGMPAGEVLEGTERIPVLVQGPVDERTDPARLASATLVAAGPTTTFATPVAAVADLAVEARIPAITRRNGERCNELLGFVGADTLPIEVLASVQANLRASGFKPPPGTRLELGGDAEESAAAAEQLVRYVPLLATVTMATLILAFRSLAIALLLGVVGVLSAGYGLLSLWLAGYPLGFNPLIGLAGLVGVTFNDSIVVLASIRADAVARTGEATAMARVIRGCLRHVLATTLTTAVGFVPFVVFSGGDFWPPLAVVLAGGVLGATPLALVFVPQAYAWLVRRMPSLVRGAEVHS